MNNLISRHGVSRIALAIARSTPVKVVAAAKKRLHGTVDGYGAAAVPRQIEAAKPVSEMGFIYLLENSLNVCLSL